MILDNLKKMKALDPGHVAESIELLPDQMRQVLDEAHLIKIPREYAKITNVVVNGMGGSSLGAYVVRSLWGDVISRPVTIASGYDVPAMVGKSTLYIVSTYSGTTEEPLAAYRQAKKRGAKILGITAKGGGTLEKLMLKENIPGYIFDARHNPSRTETNPAGQPRLGVGYSILGLGVLLAKSGLLKIRREDMAKVIAEMEIRTRKLKPAEPARLNIAKTMAAKINGRIPVLVGAEFTSGALHYIRNVINECAKSFAVYLALPDMNHYTMEGLMNPAANKNNLIFVFYDSNFYHPRVQRRSELTKKVVTKNKIAAIAHTLTAQTKIGQGFELLQAGAWTGYYLGMLYGVNPVVIPWVDWFKKELK